MIRIEIIDPQLKDKKSLIATAKYLLELAGHEMVSEDKIEKWKDLNILASQTQVPVEEIKKIINDPNKNFQPLQIPQPPLSEVEIPNHLLATVPPVMTVDELPSNTHDGQSSIDTEEELDSKNNPWDSRIHSRTKSKNADGTWKLKRGLNPLADAEIDPIIEEELIPVPDASKVFANAPKIEPEPEKDLNDFFSLLNLVTRVVRENQIEQHQIEAICQSHGVASLPLMAQHPEKIAIVIKEINKIIGE